jgi:glyoxylate reductase
VTRAWPAAVEARLAERFEVEMNRADRPLGAAELKDALGRCDAVLPTVTDRLPAALFEGAPPRARLIANSGAGTDHIDTAAAAARGIAVTNTPDLLAEETADLAMMLILTVARQASAGIRVSGATLGIVGFGRVGQALAQRARHGFGMEVLVRSRSAVPAEVLARTGARQAESLDALLPECDIVSLHCPGGAGNRHLIDARRLDLMRPGAILVNTARGELIDERALARALWFDTIGGAGLDAFEREPGVADELCAARSLVMLPHPGPVRRRTREAMGLRVIENLTDFFEGRVPRDRVA